MRNWTAIALGVALMALVTAPAVRAQQAAALSLQDYAEIQQLYARYAYGLDSGDGAMFANVFTADGVLTDESGKTTTGRNNLMSFAAANPAKGPTNVQHFIWNVK